ncbi:MAG: permease [Candidatus Puniceispirillum sp.]|nr:permease [Candidatus Pelagibacter sp.]MBA4283372.1 permease [Candidatus Puniceispirillum sp.]
MIFGYFGLLIMGACLGLLGAGGSILAIPIFIYFFQVPILKSTTYSLCIVSIIAIIAFIKSRKDAALHKAFHFAIPSVLGVFLSRSFILPDLPDSLGPYSINKIFICILLIFMYLASYFMIRPLTIISTSKINDKAKPSKLEIVQVNFLGFFVGIFMGFLGSGGGFLIIPILTLFLKLNMKQAVPTSLCIIAINSCVGFLSDKTYLDINDYTQLLQFLIFAFMGMVVGMLLNKKIDASKLKTIFGWFIFIVAFFILVKEFIPLKGSDHKQSIQHP